ncbi:putative immunity protein [Amycolatopsis minnesotensis]|uniref:Imm-5-like domain-containing protein n=1 Tax=Amycolatopsis minnesotensis TaxID=337894 RepID=A0ABN2Q200_9PSEU
MDAADENRTIELSMAELRLVARYCVESAEEVLGLFESDRPDDRRPRAAVEAAWTFAAGANRTKLQRVTAMDAHRAAKDASTEVAKHAAHAAGDAASAAYLHPLAKATQVGHILRAAAHAARAVELSASDEPGTGDRHIERARQRATPGLADVLARYPLAPTGKSRVAQLMNTLDAALRCPPTPPKRSGGSSGPI